LFRRQEQLSKIFEQLSVLLNFKAGVCLSSRLYSTRISHALICREGGKALQGYNLQKVRVEKKMRLGEYNYHIGTDLGLRKLELVTVYRLYICIFV
jgi:hypothetical protein